MFERQIRSFVRREGRLTKSQLDALEELWPKYGLSVQEGQVDLETLFEKNEQCTVEIGFGDGESLAQMAKEDPQMNFIGVEVHRPGVGRLLMSCEREALNNLRIYKEDAVDVLKECIADHSLDKVQIFFPDPWHKKRHHKRRLIQVSFLELLHQKLKSNGVVHIATDWENYAMHCLEVFAKMDCYQNNSTTNDFIEKPAYRPETKFERRGQRLGHGVWDLEFSVK